MTWKDPLEVKDFSGGQHDEWDSCEPHYCQRMRNLLLDAKGKPYPRNGLARFSPQIATSERIANLRMLRDASNYGSRRLFAYSHHKVFYSDSLSESANAFSTWTEALDPSATYSVAQNLDINTRAKMQYVDNHVYMSFQSTGYDAHSTSWLNYPKVRMLVPPATSPGAGFVAMNIGLPKVDASAFTINPSGAADAYQYQFVYAYEYGINGILYVTLGAPSAIYTVSAAQPGVAGATVTIGSITWPDNTVHQDLYPTFTGNPGVLKLYVYRTAKNQPVLQFCCALAWNANSISDHFTDASLGAPIYTQDGTAPYDECPPCKLHHVVGDFAYYGGFDIAPIDTNFPSGFPGAIQSSPGVFGSAPQSFSIQTPDHLTAIESVDLYPIFFTLRGCYRVEGSIDQYGRGTPTLRVISETVGALSQSLVARTDRGLVFGAIDGVYFTDGFQLQKLTDQFNKGYRSWFLGVGTSHMGLPSAANIAMASMAYFPQTKKFFLSSLSARFSAPLSVPNVINTGDMQKTDDTGQAAIGDIVGAVNSSPTSTMSLSPTALEVFQDALLIGDANGYVLSMIVQPAVPSEVQHYDMGSDISVSPSSWLNLPVIWDYVSPVFDFGSRSIKKLVYRISVAFKFPLANYVQFGVPITNAGYLNSSVYASIFSYNDMGFSAGFDGSSVPLTDNGVELAQVRDTNIPFFQRVWSVMRKFAKGSLRCTFKQVRITKAKLILYSSLPNNVRAFPNGTLNHAAKTFLMNSAGTWPKDSQSGGNNSDVVGQMLYLKNDNYVAGYLITADSGTTLTVTDPGATLPADGVYEWEVKGYPKDAGNCGIDSFAFFYDFAPGRQRTRSATDGQANP